MLFAQLRERIAELQVRAEDAFAQSVISWDVREEFHQKLRKLGERIASDHSTPDRPVEFREDLPQIPPDTKISSQARFMYESIKTWMDRRLNQVSRAA